MNLASRRKRLAARIIDAGLLFGLLAASTLNDWLPEPVLMLCVFAAFGVAIAQFYLLAARGQTLGKMAVRARIVRVDTGQNGGFVTNVLLRSLVNSVLNLSPFYFLVDSCLILRGERRCLHDHLAGTVVISAEASP